MTARNVTIPIRFILIKRLKPDLTHLHILYEEVFMFKPGRRAFWNLNLKSYSSWPAEGICRVDMKTGQLPRLRPSHAATAVVPKHKIIVNLSVLHHPLLLRPFSPAILGYIHSLGYINIMIRSETNYFIKKLTNSSMDNPFNYVIRLIKTNSLCH